MSVDTAPVAVVRTGLTVMVTTPDGDLLAFPVEDGQLSTGDDLEAFVEERLSNVLPALVGGLARKLVKTGAKPSRAPFVSGFGAVLARDAVAFDEPGTVELALTGTATVRDGKVAFSDVTRVEDPEELTDFDMSELLGQSPEWASMNDKLVARTTEQDQRAKQAAALDVAKTAPRRGVRVPTPVVDMDMAKGMSVTGH